MSDDDKIQRILEPIQPALGRHFPGYVCLWNADTEVVWVGLAAPPRPECAGCMRVATDPDGRLFCCKEEPASTMTEDAA